MIQKKIFYSWQDNLSHETNRKFVEECLQSSIKEVCEKKSQFELLIDQSTRNISGSPDIVDAIFKKISKSSIYIADITIVHTDTKKRNFPNSNVMIELGYAVNSVGWDNIICLFNKHYGEIENLPFNIKQRRITNYNLPTSSTPEKKSKEAKKLIDILTTAIGLILEKQELYDEITNVFKPQIDHILLLFAERLNKILNFYPNKIGPVEFFKLIGLSENQLSQKFAQSKPASSDLINNWEIYIERLEKITEHPLLIVNMDINKITSIMSLVRLLKVLNENFKTNRFYKKTKSDIASNEIFEIKAEEIGVLVFLLQEIFKAIDKILTTWGDYLLIDPATYE